MGRDSPPRDPGKLGPRSQKRAPPRHPVPALELAITSETYLPVVAGVAVIGDHVLRLLFSDGTVGDVDLSAERWTGVLEPLSDPSFFNQVAVDTESGTVAWPGGIDRPPSRSTSRRTLTRSSPPSLTVRQRPASARLPGTQLDKIHHKVERRDRAGRGLPARPPRAAATHQLPAREVR
jgi:hypothetical protein